MDQFQCVVPHPHMMLYLANILRNHIKQDPKYKVGWALGVVGVGSQASACCGVALVGCSTSDVWGSNGRPSLAVLLELPLA